MLNSSHEGSGFSARGVGSQRRKVAKLGGGGHARYSLLEINVAGGDGRARNKMRQVPQVAVILAFA